MSLALSMMVAALLGEGAYLVQPTSGTVDSLFEAKMEDWRSAVRLDFGPAEARTTFRALWNDKGLYLRFDASDPSPWFTLKRHDDPIWNEEVVEIFLDLDGSGTHYAEVELSPGNVVTDVHMIRGEPDKQMDLAFDLKGIRSRVLPVLDGKTTLGWTGLLFLPWEGFRSLPSASKAALPPKAGDRWRFNVYRIERPLGPKKPNEGAIYATWSPTRSESFHVPASFQSFEFSAR